ncbi:MAG: hypothetical protein AAB658_08105, partial [Chloroflexota bacterium]
GNTINPCQPISCQDAGYKLKAVDLFGRPTDASATSVEFSVLKHRLVPENPRAVTGPNANTVTVSWDALPACGQDPNFELTGYTVLRSTNSVGSCINTMPTDPNAYVSVATLSAVSTSLASYTPLGSNGQPAAATAAYWYRVVSTWSDACQKSAPSGAVCISADNFLHGEDVRTSYSINATGPRPDYLNVPAEALDPNTSPDPAFYGLDLNWTAPQPTCGRSIIGYHAYRSRFNGTGYVNPPIRLTNLNGPVGATSMRVDYLPITLGHDPNAPPAPARSHP